MRKIYLVVNEDGDFLDAGGELYEHPDILGGCNTLAVFESMDTALIFADDCCGYACEVTEE